MKTRNGLATMSPSSISSLSVFSLTLSFRTCLVLILYDAVAVELATYGIC